ncbi:MAG TPA: glutamate-1-semialdehyde 2,1-aminomutase [Candidatus Limnocylindria bacterium]|nr:glutamate-1-semialdehyde 2,1-aminomutase [Candidatus Limnocylindria bacterium]
MAARTLTNAALFERARALMPGGVSSPVRAYRAVGGVPPFIVSGEGARVRDAEGRTYLDLVCSWGPLIAGHAHPAVVEAIARQAARGTSYGAPTPLEIDLAERIVGAIPAVEMIRFVSSGTEAAMSALRVARAATGRDAVLKFEGCYHGHADALLAKAGSGLATLGLPASAGVPAAVAERTLTVPFNDLAAAARAARETALAAVVVEPYLGNAGCIPPEPGFLEGLRRVADETGAILVFDEVITGFRVARGGAAERTGVRPDLVCLGKVIGGGLPVGAYGGRRDLMSLVAPDGPVYQAGTLSGNPLAMAAGAATLDLLDAEAYAHLERAGARLADGLARAASAARVPVRVQRIGSMLTAFFTGSPVRDEAGARASDLARFAAFHAAMRARGVLLPPSQFECLFVSLAHDDAAIDEAAQAARDALEDVSR